MEKLLLAIGVLLLILALVALVLYGIHGQWSAIAFSIAVAALGRLILGLIEILLVPLSLPAISLARRGHKFPSFIFMVIASIATRAAYAAFCIAILIYLMRSPGPQAWLALPLSALLAGAPFAWASQRASQDQPPNLDVIASLFGVPLSGVLLLLGLSPFLALIPIAGLFLISALIHITWWITTGMRRTRFEALVGNLA